MRRIKNLFFGLLILTVTVGLDEGKCQGNRPMYEIHSMLLYNFIKYVEWPETEKTGDFVIGVIGDKKVYQTLNKWYGAKTKGEQKIVIKNVADVESMPKCHVIYISKGKSSDFSTVKNRMAGLPVLIITDKAGLGKKGSNINFKTVDNKLKFELNKTETLESNLKISQQLEKMSILVDE